MSNIFKSRIEKTFFRQKQKTIIKIHVFISVGHSFKTEISQQQISISIFIFILYQSCKFSKKSFVNWILTVKITYSINYVSIYVNRNTNIFIILFIVDIQVMFLQLTEHIDTRKPLMFSMNSTYVYQ